MTHAKDNRPSAVVVLDWPNIVSRAYASGLTLNATALYDHLVCALGPKVHIMACVVVQLQNDPAYKKLERKNLRDIGYHVVEHKVIKTDGDVDSVVSMELTKAVLTNPSLQYLFVGSGDSDFVPVMKYAKAYGAHNVPALQIGLVAFTVGISVLWKPVVNRTIYVDKLHGVTRRRPKVA